MNKEISPLDVKVLISSNKRAYDFVLDGTHFGRGDSYISEYEQVKYQYDVIDLKKWKVNENENSLETVADIECFYSDDSYIVYAKFRVTKFDLNSERVVENSSDDTKEIYFYWRGWHASKGYSPLPKELNVEDVPVERTYQWTETPVFLRLFNGKLIVHNKSLKSETTHFYILCGTVKEEANLIEIPREKKNLRSRTSFLLVVPQEHEIYVWYGSKAHNRNFLENVLLSLQEKQSGVENKPFNVIEVNEKENDEKFLSYLTGGDNDYFSLTNDLALYHHSPRLFYFHSITGDFTASEIEYTLGSDYLNPFPFLQDHLYTATQPALFLLDNVNELWVWQGWKTETTTEEQLLEFEKQRECVLKTAINYWREKKPALKENIYLVAAGVEPSPFINLFPFWTPKGGLKECLIQFSQNDDKYECISTKFFT